MNSFSNIPIEFDSLPQAENIVFRPINRKYLGVSILGTIFFYIAIAGIFYAIYLSSKSKKISDDLLIYVLIAIAGICLINIILVILGFKWKGYIIREKDIIYRTGLIFRKRVHVPFNRVQHCEVAQNLIERNVNLAKLKIYTAGGSRSDLSIPGLLQEDAIRMKQFILKKTQEDDRVKLHDDESE